MGYRTLREPLWPDDSSVELVKAAARDLYPDDPSLEAWYRGYVNDNALRRIAFDVAAVRRRLPPESRTLELGSIPPILTVALSRLGYRIEGVDVDPRRFARAAGEQGLVIRSVDIEREPLPFPDGEFDAALFMEIFEHLRIDPIFTLGQVRRVLKPGGLLFLSTPNLTSYRGLTDLIFRNRTPVDVFEQYSKLSRFGHMGHVRTYTSKEVCTFLEKIGFEVETVTRRGWIVRQPRWRQRVLDSTLGFLLPRLRSHTGVIARKALHPLQRRIDLDPLSR